MSAGCANGSGGLGEESRNPTPATLDAASDRSTFVDPQGTYRVEVDPAWEEAHGAIVAEIELWSVGEGSADFTANVNILTQTAENTALSDYLDDSQASAAALDIDLLTTDVQTGADGQQRGVSVFESEQVGNELSHLAVVIVHDDVAVVATLTTLRDEFDAIRPDVEPYLLTLRP